jgi:hypothetical protein
VLVPHARRVRQVVLVHMPLGHRPPDTGPARSGPRERDVLAAAVAVVATSAWTRRRLGELYALPADRVHVAEPGAEADLAPGSAAGGALLCVAAVTPDKGTTCCSAGWRRRWTCPGAARRGQPAPVTRRSPACAPPRAGGRAG